MLDPRDSLLQAHCPVIAAPLYGPLADMEPGQRMIVAANGVFVQFRRFWLDCITQVGNVNPSLPLPYGRVQPKLQLSFGRLPVCLIESFIAAARTALPNECAGALVAAPGQPLRLIVHRTEWASDERIDYRIEGLRDGEQVVLDLHSHGFGRAFFSSEDDADDLGVKLSGVVGNLGDELPSAAFRLCLNRVFQPLADPWTRRRRDAGPLARQP